jgi:hypothetical protein
LMFFLAQAANDYQENYHLVSWVPVSWKGFPFSTSSETMKYVAHRGAIFGHFRSQNSRWHQDFLAYSSCTTDVAEYFTRVGWWLWQYGGVLKWRYPKYTSYGSVSKPCTPGEHQNSW